MYIVVNMEKTQARTRAWIGKVVNGIDNEVIRTMNATEWDKDTEKGIVSEEMRQHMYNLWSLSGGRIGKKPPRVGASPLFLYIV